MQSLSGHSRFRVVGPHRATPIENVLGQCEWISTLGMGVDRRGVPQVTRCSGYAYLLHMRD